MKVTLLTHYKSIVQDILMRLALAQEAQMFTSNNSSPWEVRYENDALYPDVVAWSSHALACDLIYGVRIERG